ncbi:MAG: hypothetical protein ACT4PE_08350 [Candidatus Eiseniibacteriota bacterium]
MCHVLAAAVLLAAPVHAADADLATAWEYFYDADFELALGEVDRFLGAVVLDAPRLREAHALAGQCHARLGDEVAAVESFCSALAVDAAWSPDPTVFSLEELALFRRAHSECPQVASPEPVTPDPMPGGVPDEVAAAALAGSPWYHKKSFWIGTGALLTALVIAGSSSDDGAPTGDQVPGFPDPPGPAPAWTP